MAWTQPSPSCALAALALEALESPYVAQFHDEATEYAAPGPISLVIDDNVKFSISEYRESLYQEVARKKKEDRGKKKK